MLGLSSNLTQTVFVYLYLCIWISSSLSRCDIWGGKCGRVCLCFFKNITHVRSIFKFDPNCICVFVFVYLCICICVFVFVYVVYCGMRWHCHPGATTVDQDNALQVNAGHGSLSVPLLRHHNLVNLLSGHHNLVNLIYYKNITI